MAATTPCAACPGSSAKSSHHAPDAKPFSSVAACADGASPRRKYSVTSPASNAAAPNDSVPAGTANSGSSFTHSSCQPASASSTRILWIGAKLLFVCAGASRTGRTTQHSRPVCAMIDSFANSYCTHAVGAAAPDFASARIRSDSPDASFHVVSGSGAPSPPSRYSRSAACRAEIASPPTNSSGASVAARGDGANAPHSSSRPSASPGRGPLATAQ